MTRTLFLLMLLFTSLYLTGCDEKTQTETLVSKSDITKDWAGRWTGPEGTYLDIAPDYKVTIANLDGPRSFEGKSQGDAVSFMRDGKQEIIRHGSGKDTGMKWLLEKKDCLYVAYGEGYCRD